MKKKKRKRKIKQFGHDTDAYEMALYYWYARFEEDSNVHPEVQNNPEKLENMLQKWANEFNKLFNRLFYEKPNSEDIEEIWKVIQFVQHSKYYLTAKYSAGYLCANFLKIEKLMKEIELRPFMPQF